MTRHTQTKTGAVLMTGGVAAVISIIGAIIYLIISRRGD